MSYRRYQLSERMHEVLLGVLNDAVIDDPDDAEVRSLRTIIRAGKRIALPLDPEQAWSDLAKILHNSGKGGVQAAFQFHPMSGHFDITLETDESIGGASAASLLLAVTALQYLASNEAVIVGDDGDVVCFECEGEEVDCAYCKNTRRSHEPPKQWPLGGLLGDCTGRGCCVCGRSELPSPSNDVAVQLGGVPGFEKVTWRCQACNRLVCRDCVLTVPTELPAPFDREIPEQTLCTETTCTERRTAEAQ